jgi:response regulator of citrate/malate metabolism
MDDYLTKPINLTSLRKTLAKFAAAGAELASAQGTRITRAS